MDSATGLCLAPVGFPTFPNATDTNLSPRLPENLPHKQFRQLCIHSPMSVVLPSVRGGPKAISVARVRNQRTPLPSKGNVRKMKQVFENVSDNLYASKSEVESVIT